MTDRTPGPWYAEHTSAWGHVVRSRKALQPKIVAQGAAPEYEDVYIASRLGEANAEFIVRACNAHDALEHAAQAALFHLAEQDADENWNGSNSAVSDELHVALKLADTSTPEMGVE